MKAERIQTQLPAIPGWQTDAQLTAERRLEFPSFLDACRFAVKVAQWTATEGQPLASSETQPSEIQLPETHPPRPQIDIRQGQVTLRVAAEDPAFLDAELTLIDELSRLAGLLEGEDAATPAAPQVATGAE